MVVEMRASQFLKDWERLYHRSATDDESALDVAGLGENTEGSAFGDPQIVD